MEIREYTLQTLEIFIERYLDTYDLNKADRLDLKQDLALKALQLAEDDKLQYDDGNVEFRYSYLIRAYKNHVSNWHRDRIRMNKHLVYEDPQELYKALADWRYDSTRIPYYDLPVLNGLTKIEQRVITLKYMDGHSNAAIIEMLSYKHSEAGIRQIISRVRKKLAKIYPHLVKK